MSQQISLRRYVWNLTSVGRTTTIEGQCRRHCRSTASRVSSLARNCSNNRVVKSIETLLSGRSQEQTNLTAIHTAAFKKNKLNLHRIVR